MGDVVGNVVVLVLGLLFLRFAVRVARSGPFGFVITIALVTTVGYGVVSGWSGNSAIVVLGALVLYWFLGMVISGEPITNVSSAPRDAFGRRPGDPNWNQGRPGPHTHFK